MNQLNRDQIRDTDNLYDIQILSQAIINKGWACLSHTTRKDLNKAIVPTVYNDIVDKLNNVDETISSFIQKESLSAGSCVCYSNGKWFVSHHNKTYYTTNLNVALTSLNEPYNVYGSFISGNNIVAYHISTESNDYIRIINSSNLNTKTISYNSIMDNVNRTFIINGYIYIVSKTSNKLYRIVDDYNNATSFELVKTFDFYIYDIYEFNNEFYVITNDNNYIKKSSTIDGNYENVYRDSNDGSSIQNGAMICVDENFICWACGNNYPIKYTRNNFSSVTESSYSYNNPTSSLPVIWKGLLFYQEYDYEDEVTYLHSIKISTMSSHVKYSNITNMGGIGFNNKQLAVTSDTYLFYRGVSPTVYTDKYEINGATVSINYNMNGSFKICVSDGGTNDSNLETVYNYLGYYEYFLLDTINKKISLPRNSNLWTYMYISDNYQDSDLPTGTFINIKTIPEEIINSNASITLSIKANKYYKFTNSAITDITFSSCEDSNIETIIKFSTGTTEPSLTDNSGITWVNGTTPILNSNKTYLIRILNKLGFIEEY